MIYTVHFEIFGKKMKSTVKASSEEDAKYRVMGGIMKKIIWNRVDVEKTEGDGTLDRLKEMFGMK